MTRSEEQRKKRLKGGGTDSIHLGVGRFGGSFGCPFCSQVKCMHLLSRMTTCKHILTAANQKKEPGRQVVKDGTLTYRKDISK